MNSAASHIPFPLFAALHGTSFFSFSSFFSCFMKWQGLDLLIGLMPLI